MLYKDRLSGVYLRFQNADIGQVAVFLRVVEAVADDEGVLHLEAGVVGPDVRLAASGSTSSKNKHFSRGTGKMREDMERILLTESDIHARVEELGRQISRDYAGREPLFVGVLKGCFIFMADLLRSVELHCTMDFMAVSSYGDGTTTTGAVKINKDLSRDIAGRDVIIVEDILDSGVTLSYLKSYLQNRAPNSIRIITLLDKPSRRKADIKADYSGFEVEDAFVVGYGLDYAEKYRNLPYIGILKPEIYA